MNEASVTPDHPGAASIAMRLASERGANMLFLVISEPRPEPPSAVVAARQRFWTWIEPLLANGEVRSVHAKVGRGAVALFDVASNEALHAHLNAWAEIVPARFEIHALIDPDSARRFLAHGSPPG